MTKRNQIVSILVHFYEILFESRVIEKESKKTDEKGRVRAGI